MYIEKSALEESQKTSIPIVAKITEKCIKCNKASYGTLLAIHIPDMIGLCQQCYQSHDYDPEKDYMIINNVQVYGSRAMYKIGRGFIPNEEYDDTGAIDE